MVLNTISFTNGKESPLFLFGASEYGFLKGFVRFSAAEEEILAVAADRDYPGVRSADGVCKRLCDRAIYLHVVLANRRNLEPA